MFGKMGDMMGKLNEMKKQVEETKARLGNITVEGTSAKGMIKVIANGNREIKDIEINPELFHADRKEVQDLLVLAVNDALAKAKNTEEVEMKGAASGILPNIPGLGL
ncbi:MAG: YbaB/EbfC family nucleoid-associated protein [Flavobacteriales bacterium]|nr:YbaB/EbfC family nucleoid-associated protein [Flavobacteriales bacterium]